MNHATVFRYFENKLKELRDEYGFTSFDHNPCSIRKKEGLKSFVSRLASDLFEEEDVQFKNTTSANRVDFQYAGHQMHLELDKQLGHIELDFYQTIEFMAFVSGKMIARVNPTSVYLAGDYDDMKEAWSRGLPIHVPEVNFRYKHMNGKSFKKEEVGSVFIIEGQLGLREYEQELLVSLNEFLKRKAYNISYNSTQVKCYLDHRKYICTSINGDYCRGFSSSSDHKKIIFENGLENQIFLSQYLANHPDLAFVFKTKDGETRQITQSFQDFALGLGRVK